MKDNYIPQPSVEEEKKDEANYNEYRSQAEQDMNEPQHISHIIEDMEHDETTILGLLRSIKASDDAMINEENGEWNC